MVLHGFSLSNLRIILKLIEQDIRRPLLASSVFEYLTLRSRILKDLYSFKGSPSAATGRHRPPQAATGCHRPPQAGKPSGPARGSPPLILLCLEGSAAEAVACKSAAL